MTPGDTFVCVHSNRKQGSSKRNTFSTEIQARRSAFLLFAVGGGALVKSFLSRDESGNPMIPAL